LSSVADPHPFDAEPDADSTFHFNADPHPNPACYFDPDPTFHFDAGPDPDPSFQRKGSKP
jgi:hypothetical protein